MVTGYTSAFYHWVYSLPTIATLDIEASGIHADSYPIEIGVAFTDGTTWCSLIKPPPSWQHWCGKAAQVHGIPRQDLHAHGRDPVAVAATLNDLLDGAIVYSDCWVLDNPWLTKLFEQAAMEKRFTLLDMLHLLDEDTFVALSPTKQQIAQELRLKRHRASNDAVILQLAYQRLINQH